ncbi:MAG: class I SAM-dependent methyltransferase [Nitrososphaera sp.]|nr:class I SAM-dependent methyltransferase [Nitrososphaera sp.]
MTVDISRYNSVMGNVKDTTKYPVEIAGTHGLLARPEAEWFVRLHRALGSGLYGELGTFRGRSACLMVAGFNNDPNSKLVTVDKFDQKTVRSKYRYRGDQDLYENVLELFKSKGFDKCIQVIKSDTSAAANLFEDGTFIFLFIDADHSYEGVKADFTAWQSKLTLNGIIAFHDSHHVGVEKLLSEIKDKWKQIDRVHSLSVWRRRE